MGKNPRISDPIDRLLQERQQYATWLARLDATKDTAPETVRGKVRSDYQARLNIVIDQLRSHADDLAQQLNRDRENRTELLLREEREKETLSEAEVRHAVGEYNDPQWQSMRGEAQKKLVSIREELVQLNGEIAELEKAQALISSPAIPEPVETPPPAPSLPPAPPAAEAEPVAPPAAATPQPPPSQSVPVHAASPEATPTPGPGQTTARPAATVRPVKPKEGTQTPGRTLWFPSVKDEEVNAGVDELAFLKSVSEDEKAGPSPRRASGGVQRPVEPTPVGSSGAPVGESGRPSSGTGARTLKCGECGTMNRPTEWYCERCGAELADL